MTVTKLLLAMTRTFFLAVALPLTAQDSTDTQTESEKTASPQSAAFLKSLVGKWEGNCRTWFQPGKLADESEVKGEFKLLFGGRFLRHTYESSMKGKPRTGEETIAFNSVKKKFQSSWIDDFHMSYGILFSEGNGIDNGFSVTGKYSAGPGQPPWGWKTVFDLTDKDHLTVTAYNIFPNGKEAKAVETKYTRISDGQ